MQSLCSSEGCWSAQGGEELMLTPIVLLVGMKAVVMDDAIIGKNSIIAACAFVKSKFTCEQQKMIIGAPGKIHRDLSDDEVKWKSAGTQEYVNLAHRCQTSLREVEPLKQVQENRPRFEGSEHNVKGG